MQSLSAVLMAQVSGRVIDAKTREALDFVNVFYDGKNVGEQTDADGRFVIREDSAWTQLTISSMGYVTKVIPLKYGKNKNLTIKLEPEPRTLSEVTVSAKRGKYSRKNNPAVELMRKVIAHKNTADIRSNDYYSYTKYERMTTSVNEVTDKVFDEGEFKKFAFLKDHVERCPQTDKLILPITVNEIVSEVFYRKDPKTEKVLIKAESNKGINELINTGDILTTMLKDVFTDVNIYDNECRLLQYPFKSPIADNAIGFYRYYLQDTIKIENDSVIDVGFLPNNQQDFGFSGHVYVMKDSTYQVRRVTLNIPRRSDVNFVENMIITQDLITLPSGERIAEVNDMLVELKVAFAIGKFNVQRVTRLSDISTEPIADRVFKMIKGPSKKDPDAEMQGDNFWQKYRKVEMTKSESNIDAFINKIKSIKGFKYIIFVAQAFIENFVETSDSLATNKVDIGPINTMISQNHYDGLRLRLSALTTANLSPHLFASGYLAYGTKTNNWYGRAQLTYAFNKKAYLPREFPQNNLTAYFWDDIMTPFDKFIPTDKDNVFTSLRTNKVDQYNHTREFHINYTREYENGFKYYLQYTNTRNRPVDALFYQRLGSSAYDLDGNLNPEADITSPINDSRYWVRQLQTSEFKAGISFEPGAVYINTKQRRIRFNKEAPILSLSHTLGLNGFLGGHYTYNVTELGIFKRLWLGSFGKMDFDVKAGAQWNKVPFPLLIHPAANQSYIIEDFTFNLISNLEFLNDRYATLIYEWDLSGKLFNRIPLLKKLKWRELIGLNVLWGSLTDKNNPASSNYTDSKLFYFPGHFRPDGTYEQNTVRMSSTPYMELRVGIHNIFKLIEVDYVYRLTYRDTPNVSKWGIRFWFRMSF